MSSASANAQAPKSAPPPVLTFDSTSFERRDRGDAWREHIRYYLDARAADDDRDDFRVVSRSWQLGDCIFGNVASEPMLWRVAGAQLANAGPLLGVRLTRRGRWRGLVDGSYFEFGPDTIGIVDQTVERVGIETDVEHLSLFVPQAAVGYLSGRHPSHISLETTSPVGRVLRERLDSLARVSLEVGGPAAWEVRDGLVALLAPLIGPPADRDGSVRAWRRARLAAIKRHIDARIEDPGLSADDLQRTFGLSRASLFRLFADEGGVRAYVQGRRVERALEPLTRLAPRRGAVRETAAALGLHDASHFNRLFRRRFGVNPSDVLGVFAPAKPAADAPAPAPHPYEHVLSALDGASRLRLPSNDASPPAP